MRVNERRRGLLLKKGRGLFLTTDDKWKEFGKTTKEFDNLDAVKSSAKETRAKTTIIEVVDTFGGKNDVTFYERIERVLKNDSNCK